MNTAPKSNVLEFYAGIGGLSCAWPEAEQVTAIDISTQAQAIYEANFSHSYWTKEIESLSADALIQTEAEGWWLSPPCQPYCRRGNHRDLDDPRSQSFLHLLTLLQTLRPAAIALENVPGFAHSLACQRLCDTLRQLNYHWESRQLCPTQFGWPNRRQRFYLIAAQQALPTWRPICRYSVTLDQLIGSAQPGDLAALWLEPRLLTQYASALDVVEAAGTETVTACFASGYGKSVVRSGSCLRVGERVRRFAPDEVKRLLGFPETFQLEPPALRELANTQRIRSQWKLLGNSLSLPVVRYVLSHLPMGPDDPRLADFS